MFYNTDSLKNTKKKKQQKNKIKVVVRWWQIIKLYRILGILHFKSLPIQQPLACSNKRDFAQYPHWCNWWKWPVMAAFRTDMWLNDKLHWACWEGIELWTHLDHQDSYKKVYFSQILRPTNSNSYNANIPSMRTSMEWLCTEGRDWLDTW